MKFLLYSVSFSVSLLLWLFRSTGGSSKGSDTCRVLGFHPLLNGKRLKHHVIQKKRAGSEDFCQALCYMDNNCRSINFNQTKDSDGTHLCELNNSDNVEHPADLKKKHDFTYRGTKTPCSSNPCKRNATCQTGFGSKGYRCVCPAGYTGELCEQDIDECATMKPCHANANCTNTLGSYVCNCSTGYQGNGSHCEDINECDKSNPCHANANCTNTPGSYVCNCSTGYQGNGSHCKDINECDKSNPCHDNANCTNTPGSYVCNCSTGYEGNGSHCEDINECDKSKPCHVNANCTNTPGSYVCNCSTGYEGNGSHCEELFPSVILSGHPEYETKLREYLTPVEVSGDPWILCFRASEHQYRSAVFHTACDLKGPTVTLVRVGTHVFGFYADKSWNKVINTWIKSNATFLFSLKNDLNEQYKIPIDQQYQDYAIYSRNNYGPTFGAKETDPAISDACNIGTSSTASLGYSFSEPNGYTAGTSQANNLLAGSPNYKCDEYEVFYQASTSAIMP